VAGALRYALRPCPVDHSGRHLFRGAVSLLGFRRQLLVEAGARRRVLHLEPPANLPRYLLARGEAPSGSLAVRHLAGPGMF